MVFSEVQDSTQISESRCDVPKTAAISIISRTGQKLVVYMIYKSCRRFATESTLSFKTFDESSGTQLSGKKKNRITIDPGLSIQIRLVAPLKAATAWTGDRITGVVVAPVKRQNGTIAINKGSRVTGRILRWQEIFGIAPHTDIGLLFDSIELGGNQVPVSLTCVSLKEGEGTQIRPQLSSGKSIAQFVIRGTTVTLNPRLTTDWVTIN